MYCSKCGKELPDDAQFCLKCGTVVSGKSGTRGHWEYQEFSESLEKYAGGKEITIGSNQWGPMNAGIILHDVIKRPVAQAVRALLARVGADGWEPMDSLEPERLWAAQQIGYRDVSSFLNRIAGTTGIVLVRVTINFRRWVEN